MPRLKFKLQDDDGGERELPAPVGRPVGSPLPTTTITIAGCPAQPSHYQDVPAWLLPPPPPSPPPPPFRDIEQPAAEEDVAQKEQAKAGNHPEVSIITTLSPRPGISFQDLLLSNFHSTAAPTFLEVALANTATIWVTMVMPVLLSCCEVTNALSFHLTVPPLGLWHIAPAPWSSPSRLPIA